ncbi:MAG TPA: hypothetical protein PK605_00245 [Ignavibacteria bacterium]|nr:hypothetical protein [Bacteroidota bacterium]HRE10790.1 hypothetical protein [Ignavibacteria bacterium]HRF65967.1 hypothetical protein [Ignavibacteria bacterium]HRJ02808.1 hypothetical protein [Ignavibacteria bacterium]HRJ84366.1 hypothetical protein [Ignavibacteria bacterium]
MKKSDVHELTGHSRGTINKAEKGELKNEVLSEKIMTLLALEHNYLEDIFLDDRFVEMMELVITKAPSSKRGVELRKYAVLAQHTSVTLRNRKNKGKE